MGVGGEHLLTITARLEGVPMPRGDRKSALRIKIECCRSLKHALPPENVGIQISHLNLLFSTVEQKKWQVKNGTEVFSVTTKTYRGMLRIETHSEMSLFIR